MLSSKFRIWDDTMFASTPEVTKVLDNLRQVRDEIKRLQKVEEDLKQVLYNFVGEHEAIIDPLTGEELAQWKYTEDSLRFDSKRFQEEHAGIAASYLVKVPGHRKLRLL